MSKKRAENTIRDMILDHLGDEYPSSYENKKHFIYVGSKRFELTWQIKEDIFYKPLASFGVRGSKWIHKTCQKV
jgi:hypothetical protein